MLCRGSSAFEGISCSVWKSCILIFLVLVLVMVLILERLVGSKLVLLVNGTISNLKAVWWRGVSGFGVTCQARTPHSTLTVNGPIVRSIQGGYTRSRCFVIGVCLYILKPSWIIPFSPGPRESHTEGDRYPQTMIRCMNRVSGSH